MEDKKQPLVSIGMPVFNGEKGLVCALDSLLAQDYRNLEIIISDNASSDATPAICRSYAAKDIRIKYYKAETNLGSVANFNRVFELSSGEYFMWAAHDDKRAPSFVSECVEMLEKHPGAVLCQSYTDSFVEGRAEKLCTISLDTFVGVAGIVGRYKEALKNLPATAMYGLYRSSIMRKTMMFRKSIATDIAFIQELSIYGDFVQVQKPLFRYFSREKWNTLDQDYRFFLGKDKRPWWYLPFAALFCDHWKRVGRSSIYYPIKLRLWFELIRYQAVQVGMKVFIKTAGLLFPVRLKEMAEPVIYKRWMHNPNVNIDCKELYLERVIRPRLGWHKTNKVDSKKTVISQAGPRALFLDTAYTLKMCRERELEQEFVSRECGGYFDHIWGVHPIADIPENRKPECDGFKVSITEFSGRQTAIEGSSAYFQYLKYCFPLNFIVSQIRLISYLIGLVKRERIQFIISTDPYFCGIIGLAVKIFSGASLVVWVAANYDDTFKATGIPAMPRLFRWRWVEKMIERIVFSCADLVAGVNRNNLEFALKNGARRDRATIFSNGKLINQRHLMEPCLRDKDDFFISSSKTRHFIYVGRLTEVKHPDDVLRAFSVIDKNVPGCALIMAGDGPMRGWLEKLAHELNISSRVYFLGNLNQNSLANLLAGCFASLSPLTGRSLFESALAGLPIVAYDRDWQGDFVGGGGAGLVVPFRDWQKMGEAAIYLLRHADETTKMALASRRKGLQECSLEDLYAHEKKEFDNLLMRKTKKY
ncbi:MAG: glycosyltransferase [Candidatus Omnitrophota bacterium]